jgi:hypothetical protein
MTRITKDVHQRTTLGAVQPCYRKVGLEVGRSRHHRHAIVEFGVLDRNKNKRFENLAGTWARTWLDSEEKLGLAIERY